MIAPKLNFPSAVFGANETHWSLDALLYKGGAASDVRRVRIAIESGALGEMLPERLPLVVKIHKVINWGLVEGGSRDTAGRAIELVRMFAAFCDESNRKFTLEESVKNYAAWTTWLLQRTKLPKNGRGISGEAPISASSGYGYAAFVGTILDRVLEHPSRLIETTSLARPVSRKSAIGIVAEKQNLGDTFAMGSFLQDLCDGIDLGMVYSTARNIPIILRSGKTFVCKDRSSLHKSKTLRENFVEGVRYSIVNLRVEAELLMFIGQTGINLEQALNAKLVNFFYIGYLDGYQVKEFKRRRGGPVLFEIFKEYKLHFERYLQWRVKIFPESPYLFPFISKPGVRRRRTFRNERVKLACAQMQLAYIPPRQLRNTRVNWLLRHSSDLDQTAAMAQHTRKTLVRIYHRPSLQRALAECTRFWSKFDPHQNRTLSVAPGVCSGSPKVLEKIPHNAPTPDCRKTSGCLWCENHRDVDSFDYVWALTSFMHLKAIELSKSGPPLENGMGAPPAKIAIDRMLEKIDWFEKSSEKRRAWVQEARELMSDESFHPNFSTVISDIKI